ncbi:MAG: methyltransferase [Alcanivoracaceae bacterium]|nr:methyltransferase [Alcanivoracaceae bacterium]
MKALMVSVALIFITGCQTATDERDTSNINALRAVTELPTRTPSFVERDQFRHPAETLAFFGIKPNMTVVEIWPGPAGWYTEILAPYLRDNGKLYAAHFPADTGIEFYTSSLKKFESKLAHAAPVYDKVEVTYFYPPEHTSIAPTASADLVLTFRNVHNWAKAGNAQGAFNAFFEAIKPGGILGVVEHRADEGTALNQQIESGYMTESYVIELAEAAGFKLDSKSEINANPHDNHDHPAGVWSLPPSLRLGEKDKAQYLQIGESDRMTLKFVKP